MFFRLRVAELCTVTYMEIRSNCKSGGVSVLGRVLILSPQTGQQHLLELYPAHLPFPTTFCGMVHTKETSLCVALDGLRQLNNAPLLSIACKKPCRYVGHLNFDSSPTVRRVFAVTEGKSVAIYLQRPFAIVSHLCIAVFSLVPLLSCFKRYGTSRFTYVVAQRQT
jgi:hypothetical protein